MQKIASLVVFGLMSFSSVALAAKLQHSVIDDALVNESKIAYWLEKRGEITSADSDAEIKVKVAAYIKRYRSLDKRNIRLPQNYRIQDKSNKFGRQYAITNTNQSTDVNVLAVLIDFPNLTYSSNGLSSNDTDLFYNDYSLAHYRDLLFSADGFDGPSGENLMSVNQYYDLESGSTFHFNGQAYGWYRSTQPAAFYGGNGEGGSDSNVEALVVEAIEAAVANGSVNLNDYDKKDPQDLDKDNIIDEPDGYIDHVLIVHSSVGEEAGGGVLGSNAIWSHRFSVSEKESAITGSAVKVRNYTIVPIDSGSGVIAHEFGHDLGLNDEYDLNSTLVGSPVGYWSIMSGGSWLGERRGTQPTSFSPLARDLLQQKFGGSWINQQEIDAATLTSADFKVALTQASDHNTKINQAKITLPPHKERFGKAQQGEYQLLADHQDQVHFRQDFSINVPNDSNAQLSLWARWDIEQGYDYARFLINGNPLRNDFTIGSSSNIPNVTNLLTGQLTGSPWTNLVFGLSTWQGQRVTLSIEYVTDPAVGGFGIAIDDIKILSDNGNRLIDDFETAFTQTSIEGFTSFERISEYKDAAPEYYYIQVRSNEKLDVGLVGERYDPGVLLWYRNDAYTNNNSSEHPGQGFISVIDADQNRLSFGNTERQIRDAAFSLYPQTPLSGDTHLTANSQFSDENDYSAPAQPQSGTKLPLWGIKFTIEEQDIQSRNASILLSRNAIVLSTEIGVSRDALDVSFNQNVQSSYPIVKTHWDFGDDNFSDQENPSHRYESGGQYRIVLSVEDSSGATYQTEQLINVQRSDFSFSANNLTVAFTPDIKFPADQAVFQWNFGDGRSASSQLPNHVYSNSGTYDVTLTISDNVGVVGQVTKQITVSQATNTLAISESNSSGGAVSLVFLGICIIGFRQFRTQ